MQRFVKGGKPKKTSDAQFEAFLQESVSDPDEDTIDTERIDQFLGNKPRQAAATAKKPWWADMEEAGGMSSSGSMMSGGGFAGKARDQRSFFKSRLPDDGTDFPAEPSGGVGGDDEERDRPSTAPRGRRSPEKDGSPRRGGAQQMTAESPLANVSEEDEPLVFVRDGKEGKPKLENVNKPKSPGREDSTMVAGFVESASAARTTSTTDNTTVGLGTTMLEEKEKNALFSALGDRSMFRETSGSTLGQSVDKLATPQPPGAGQSYEQGYAMDEFVSEEGSEEPTVAAAPPTHPEVRVRSSQDSVSQNTTGQLSARGGTQDSVTATLDARTDSTSQSQSGRQTTGGKAHLNQVRFNETATASATTPNSAQTPQPRSIEIPGGGATTEARSSTSGGPWTNTKSMNVTGISMTMPMSTGDDSSRAGGGDATLKQQTDEFDEDGAALRKALSDVVGAKLGTMGGTDAEKIDQLFSKIDSIDAGSRKYFSPTDSPSKSPGSKTPVPSSPPTKRPLQVTTSSFSRKRSPSPDARSVRITSSITSRSSASPGLKSELAKARKYRNIPSSGYGRVYRPTSRSPDKTLPISALADSTALSSARERQSKSAKPAFVAGSRSSVAQHKSVYRIPPAPVRPQRRSSSSRSPPSHRQVGSFGGTKLGTMPFDASDGLTTSSRPRSRERTTRRQPKVERSAKSSSTAASFDARVEEAMYAEQVQLRGRLAALEDDNERLRERARLSDTERVAWQQKYELLRVQTESSDGDLAQRLSTADTENAVLRTKLAAAQHDLRMLAVTKQPDSSGKHDKFRMKKSQESDREEDGHVHEELRKRMVEQENLLQGYEAENKRLYDKIKSFENERKSSDEAFALEKKRLEKEMSDVYEQLANKKRILERHESLITAEGRNDVLRQSREEMNDRLRTLERDIGDLRDENERLRGDMSADRRRSRSHSPHHDHGANNEELAAVKAELKARDDVVEKLIRENVELRRKERRQASPIGRSSSGYGAKTSDGITTTATASLRAQLDESKLILKQRHPRAIPTLILDALAAQHRREMTELKRELADVTRRVDDERRKLNDARDRDESDQLIDLRRQLFELEQRHKSALDSVRNVPCVHQSPVKQVPRQPRSRLTKSVSQQEVGRKTTVPRTTSCLPDKTAAMALELADKEREIQSLRRVIENMEKRSLSAPRVTQSAQTAPENADGGDGDDGGWPSRLESPRNLRHSLDVGASPSKQGGNGRRSGSAEALFQSPSRTASPGGARRDYRPSQFAGRHIDEVLRENGQLKDDCRLLRDRLLAAEQTLKEADARRIDLQDQLALRSRRLADVEGQLRVARMAEAKALELADQLRDLELRYSAVHGSRDAYEETRRELSLTLVALDGERRANELLRRELETARVKFEPRRADYEELVRKVDEMERRQAQRRRFVEEMIRLTAAGRPGDAYNVDAPQSPTSHKLLTAIHEQQQRLARRKGGSEDSEDDFSGGYRPDTSRYEVELWKQMVSEKNDQLKSFQHQINVIVDGLKQLKNSAAI